MTNAGQTLPTAAATASVAATAGTLLTTVFGTFSGVNDADLFAFRITGASTFSATTNNTLTDTGGRRARTTWASARRATGQARAVIGLDLSPTALAKARRKPMVANETYLEVDIFALPDDLRGRFDWVFEHTCFCAIDPTLRRDYVRAMANALKPGGHLLAIFYLRPWANGESRRPSAARLSGRTWPSSTRFSRIISSSSRKPSPRVAIPGARAGS